MLLQFIKFLMYIDIIVTKHEFESMRHNLDEYWKNTVVKTQEDRFEVSDNRNMCI